MITFRRRTHGTTTNGAADRGFTGKEIGMRQATNRRLESSRGPLIAILLAAGLATAGAEAATYSISGNTDNRPGVTVRLAGAAAHTTTTDTFGNFKFTGLANGSYSLTPSKEGYTFSPTTKSVSVNGANVTGQNFTVVYTLAGHVRSSSGTALSGVAVKLSGAATRSTTTDGTGKYSFAGLAPGSYKVTALIPHDKTTQVSTSNVMNVDFP